MRTLFRHPLRVWHVVAVFFGLFIAPALHLPGADHHPGPVRLRLAFERLGGAWVKLGQMLALRYDILPVPYCDELFRLLNQVAPFTYDAGPRDHPARARRRARGRSSRPSSTSRSPRRRSGRSTGPASATATSVAVKVQRPHIRETLQADIDLMYARDVAARLDAAVRRRPRAGTSSTSSPAGRRTRSTTSSRPARPSCCASTRRATATSESPACTATTRPRAS